MRYLSLLPYPVSSCLSLQVILGVPVWVKYDHGISRSQVNAQATCSCGQQETEVLQRGKKKTDRQTDKKQKQMFMSSLKTQHLHILCKRAENLPQTLLHWNDPTPVFSSHPWWNHPTSARQHTFQPDAPNIFTDCELLLEHKRQTRVLWSPGIRTGGSSGSLQGCPASGPSGRRWAHGGRAPSAAPGACPEVPAYRYCELGAKQNMGFQLLFLWIAYFISPCLLKSVRATLSEYYAADV